MDPSEQTRDGAETPGGLALAGLRADIVSAQRKGDHNARPNPKVSRRSR
jgi:hypothetical protein